VATQAIRRKPLSSTASPIASRYSSGEHLSVGKDFPTPDQRYSRSQSVDSPTVYEFPHHNSSAPFTALRSPIREAISPTETVVSPFEINTVQQ
jgi:hypothetical protein